MEKYATGDKDYHLPNRLVELIENKDFGEYADNGILPVCFIASNHTTGGNSGSPVLDSKGAFIGINFDRSWEGTMSDLNYDISLCRNIGSVSVTTSHVIVTCSGRLSTTTICRSV